MLHGWWSQPCVRYKATLYYFYYYKYGVNSAYRSESCLRSWRSIVWFMSIGIQFLAVHVVPLKKKNAITSTMPCSVNTTARFIGMSACRPKMRTSFLLLIVMNKGVFVGPQKMKATPAVGSLVRRWLLHYTPPTKNKNSQFQNGVLYVQTTAITQYQ